MIHRVLLVDPNPVSRKLRAKLLNASGYAVFPATGIQDAISRVKPNSYSIVLVSGDDEEQALGFCEEVRRNHPKQLVVVLARPGAYIPEHACPDEVLQGHTNDELLRGIDAALQN